MHVITSIDRCAIMFDMFLRGLGGSRLYHKTYIDIHTLNTFNDYSEVVVDVPSLFVVMFYSVFAFYYFFLPHLCTFF